MHYGMLIHMPYWNECDICAECSDPYCSSFSGEEFILTFLAGGSWLTKINDKIKSYRRFFSFERSRKMITYEGSKKRPNSKNPSSCK